MKPDKKATSASRTSKSGKTPEKSSKAPSKVAAKPEVKAAPKAAAPEKKAAPDKAEPQKSKAVKTAPAMPSILLEGDAPSAPAASGPGQRYSLGPSAPVEHFTATGELPESYGTRKLLLAARDPHWLYAHWDLTREQLRDYNAQSRDHHLVLRVFENAASGSPLMEVHVHPDSRNWFVHVGRAGTRFVAELGLYNAKGKWQSVSISGATLTPPDALSDDTSVRFATLPMDVPFERLIAIVKKAVREHVPLIEAIQQLRSMGYGNLPDVAAIQGGSWTPEQERALSEIITMDAVRRVWMGSLEITELIRRQMLRDISSAAVSQFSLPSSPMGALGSVSSPFGAAGVPGARGFWFNVNAELIIYGATEPDAQVSIGGRVIRLRQDGTFSYRFALPDGAYELPAVAVSSDKAEARMANLKFMRSTDYVGDVGAHPQDPALKPPLPENVA